MNTPPEKIDARSPSEATASRAISDEPIEQQKLVPKRDVYHLTDVEIESLRANSKAFGEWAKEQLRIDRKLRHLR